MCSFKANAGSKQSKQEKRPLAVRLNMGEGGGEKGGGEGYKLKDNSKRMIKGAQPPQEAKKRRQNGTKAQTTRKQEPIDLLCLMSVAPPVPVLSWQARLATADKDKSMLHRSLLWLFTMRMSSENVLFFFLSEDSRWLNRQNVYHFRHCTV